MTEMNELFCLTLNECCKKFNINLTTKQIEKYMFYYELLIKQSRKINLTTITKPQEVAEKHFFDALTLYAEMAGIVNTFSSVNLVDIGSGAGFPGLPLKIYCDQFNVTLLESVGKKVDFMHQVIKKLALTNTEAVNVRAEDFAKKAREVYHIGVSRAVAELNVLLEYSLPLIKVNGIFVAAKGPNVEDELKTANNALNILGGKIKTVKKLVLPISGENRVIVTIQKIKSTPDKYPRRAGIPTKRPL